VKNSVLSLLNEAEHYVTTGHLGQAEQCYQKLLQVDASNPRVLTALGSLYLRQRHFAEARQYFTRALKLSRKSPDILTSLATASYGLGEWQAAIRYARQAIRIDGAQVQAHFIQAESLRCDGKYQPAIDCYLRALSLRPDLSDVSLGLSIAYRNIGELDAAAGELETLLVQQPGHVGALNNLGNIFLQRGRVESAESCYRRALDINPGLLDAWVNMGVACEQLGLLDRASEAYQQALELRPDPWPRFEQGIFPDDTSALLRKARINLVALKLRRGQFASGWAQYDYRLTSSSSLFHQYRFKGHLWRGQSLMGKSIYLMREQGLGDEICYASFIPDIIRQARRCVIECQPRLLPLFQAAFAEAQIVAVNPQDNDWPRRLQQLDIADCDYYSPLPSLGTFIRTSAADFQPAAYLNAEQHRVDYWKQKLGETGRSWVIGISWRGGSQATHGAARSVPLEQLLAALPGDQLQLVSLQYGDCAEEFNRMAEQYAVHIQHWPQAIDDYSETAALVMAVDLVICVDTSLAHLAGALGQNTWCLLPACADWRWQLDRTDSLWYPQMRLYRQSGAGDWTQPLAAMADDLRQYVSGHKSVT
jgi:tetratricopeptide (TPR) repeat protein